MKRLFYLLLIIFSLLNCQKEKNDVETVIKIVPEDKSKVIRFAHEDKNAYPWVFPIGENKYTGLDIEFIKLLEKELSIKIKLTAMPWKRCLVSMKSGVVDGIFASSYSKKREEYGVYPFKENHLDETKQIHISGYSLYTLKKNNITYDGKIIKNLYKKVGAQSGFSIVDHLKKMGVCLETGTNNPIAILKMLLNDRISAAAIQTARADKIISSDVELMNKIKKIKTRTPPFNQKPYFIMLSHELVKKNPKLANKLWNACDKVHKSKEYKNAENKFYEKY